MIVVDVKSRIPIYEQIIASVKDSVVSGLMTADEPLPSVRSLAGELAINPNTIQKAYSELERQGIVYSVPGRGSFIASDTASIERQHREKILSDLAALVDEALKSGIDIGEIKSLIEIKRRKTTDDLN
ncbi:MAG: GntR family transcriptional regulator [Clostridia bacterium]|nr:GntR family transcriptional regulator [Clostridia bacterium]